MRLSQYAIFSQSASGNIVYSGMSGAVLRLSGDAFAALVEDRADQAPLEHNDLLQLKRTYVLVEDEQAELEILRRRYLAGRCDRSHLGLTILTSLGCNFACPYCYEAKEPSLIKPEVREALVDHVALRADGLKTLHVHWLGGEPLMARRQLVELSGRFLEVSREHSVLYFANITTNGYLLTGPVSEELLGVGITHAQVCLDGTPSTHDRMRPLASGRGTFWQILQNVEESSQILDVTVRVNVDANNFDTTDELLDLLASRGLQDRITIYAGQLVKVDDDAPIPTPSATYPSPCFTGPEFASREAVFLRNAAHKGFNRPALPGPIATPCTAVREDEFVVGSDGELYKCWENVGNKRKTVGSILDGQGLGTAKPIKEWSGYSPFEDGECLECIALPSCMGGCLHHYNDPRLRHSRCSTFRDNHLAQVELFAQHTLGRVVPGPASASAAETNQVRLPHRTLPIFGR